MKQLKEIFGRKTSIWLSLELVLVTFACWWAFDPVIVTSYVTNLPLGYDPDRLVRFEVASTLPTQQLFTTQIPIGLEEESLLHKVQEMDGVEMAYRAFNNPIGSGITSMAYYLIRDNDTLRVTNYGFGRDDKMFEVFGIQSLTPGTVKAHYYGYNPDKLDYEWMIKDLPIRAVVEDVRYGVYDRDYTILFVCQGAPGINVPIIARLREGVDAQRFMEEHQHEVQHDLMTKHCYVSQMQTVREGAKAYTDRYGTSRMTHRNLLIAAFFAINLAFGVFGTLLMYTRQRREEAGVRRAFGATKWSVFWGFIREAWLLTTVSVIVGCIVYFQFAAAQGLFKGFEGSNPAVRYWFDDFGTHFLVVSVIVYLIILCAVLVATAIPAWRICRSEITVALKDE